MLAFNGRIAEHDTDRESKLEPRVRVAMGAVAGAERVANRELADCRRDSLSSVLAVPGVSNAVIVRSPGYS